MTEEMSAAEAAGRELAKGWPPLPPEVVERAARIIAGRDSPAGHGRRLARDGGLRVTPETAAAAARILVGVPPGAPEVASVPRVALTADEAAEACGVARDTIMRAIRAGRLRAKRSGEGGGGKYLITIASLEAWVAGMPDA